MAAIPHHQSNVLFLIALQRALRPFVLLFVVTSLFVRIGEHKMSRRVSYFMDNHIGGWHYGENHPMKPHRIAITNNLVLAYGLHHKMDVYAPRLATAEEMKQFHDPDYIEFLRRISPTNQKELQEEVDKFKVGIDKGDCPIMGELFEYCQRYTGGSIDGARKLINGENDIAINWAGGLHHARKSNASGFCYVNDIVLAIIELLKVFPRVLYIDIDIHHGDGVEHAFYETDRVLTLSFHKYGDGFFPGTGNVFERGYGVGKYYAANVPLKNGIRDDKYEKLFKPIVRSAIEIYQPSVIVLQCGADALSNDWLGTFNLTTRGHGKCVRFVKSFGLPILALGGGGYNIVNVARCWVNNTGILTGHELEEKIPCNDYSEYYAPKHNLHIKHNQMADENEKKFVEAIKSKVLQNLHCLTGAPSVQMQEIPSLRDIQEAMEEDSDDDKPMTSVRQKNGEYFDNDRDNKGESSAAAGSSKEHAALPKGSRNKKGGG